MSDDYPLVPQFRDLIFANAGGRLDELIQAIEARLMPPWERALATESDHVLQGHDFRVFTRTSTPGQPGLNLFFVANSAGDVYVPNIVPTSGDNLAMDEYNEALVQFYDRFAHPAAEALKLSVDLTDPVADLRKILDTSTHEALVAFSRLANKASGSGHPSDRRRWLEFLVLLDRSGRELSPEVLREWLVRDGWGEDVAFDLTVEHDFGMDLLKHARTR